MSIPSDQFWEIVEGHAHVWRAVFRRAAEIDDPDALLNDLRLRLWRAWCRQAFTCHGQIIGYGNRAASSVLADAYRAYRVYRVMESLDRAVASSPDGEPLAGQYASDADTPEAAERADWRQSFWATLDPVLTTDADRVAVRTLAADIPPAQVVALFPALFPAANQVYSARKNFKARIAARPDTLQALRELRATA